MYYPFQCSVIVYWYSHVMVSDEVLEQRYEEGLRSFLRVAYQYTDFSFSLYCSGYVFQWLARKHQEVIDVMGELIRKGRLEILAGVFYEPFFSLVPRMDYARQIEMYMDMIRHFFGHCPRGFCLPLQMWEPSIIPVLTNARVQYTFLPSQAMRRYGICDVFQPHIMERDGKTIIIFPTHKLSVHEFFSKHMMILGRKLGLGKHPYQKIVFLLSAEDIANISEQKMRQWGETLRESCFDALVLNIPKKWYRKLSDFSYISRVNIPESPYGDLFIRRRNMQSKRKCAVKVCLEEHPESDTLYAKMRYLNILVKQFRGDKARKTTAQQLIWNAQAYYAFWAGDNPAEMAQLRGRYYHFLLEAEKTLRLQGVFVPSVLSVDYDFDGKNELLYTGHDINAYIHPRGAVLFELDWIKKFWNYGNTSISSQFTTKCKSCSRYSFADHFFRNPASKRKKAFPYLFADIANFSQKLYRIVKIDKSKRMAEFESNATLYHNTVIIRKQFRFFRDALSVNYVIRGAHRNKQNMIFAPEIVFVFPDSKQTRVYVGKKSCQIPCSIVQQDEVFLEDAVNHSLMTLSFSRPADCFITHEYARLSKNQRVLPVYQHTLLFPYWQISLQENEDFSVTIMLRLSKR